MSRVFQPKSKDMANLEVIKAKDAWTVQRNGKFSLSPKYDFYGRVEKGLTSFVTMTNRKGTNTKYVEDVCKLSKKTKNAVVKELSSNSSRVVYLVKKK